MLSGKGLLFYHFPSRPGGRHLASRNRFFRFADPAIAGTEPARRYPMVVSKTKLNIL